MKVGIVYKVTSPSGKVYIGQTQRELSRRKKIHEYGAFNENSLVFNSKFSRAIRKYQDVLKWEILYENIPIEKLHELEIQEINNYDSFRNGYNGTLGGKDAGFRGKRHSEETKIILSEIRRGNKNPMHGKSGSLNPFFGKKHSEETKEKLRKSRPKMMGKNNPMFGKSAMRGKKHSLETIEKMKLKVLNRRRNEDGTFVDS